MKATSRHISLGVRIEDYNNIENQECFNGVRISINRRNVPNDIVEKELRRAFEVALEKFFKTTK